jgi:uncharacterized protein YjbI with pentapeptide repeats
MADPIQVGKLNDGFTAWNTWRASNSSSIDLTRASFLGKNFTNFDLRFANFEHASLRGARLGYGTQAWNADFSFAELCEANFEGTDLYDANFNGADIFNASFRDANLRSADLSNVRGALRQEQLAGADLTAAKLPQSVSRLLASLDNLKSLSESAHNLFFAMLAACLYSWLTIATTTDVNLITNHASSPLPIIQTSIPIVGFFIVTPLLLLGIYFYFHFYLQKLMEEVASLPAVFQDGRPLHSKFNPWLINELVRSHFSRLKVERPFLSYVQLWISVLLAWWVVPITMFLFWGRYLRRHEWYGTIFHVVTLTVAIVGAWSLTRLIAATLRRTGRPPFNWKSTFTSRRLYQAIVVTVAGLAFFGAVSLGAIRGDLPENILERRHLDVAELRMHTLIPALMWLIGYHPFADLSGQDISIKGTNWTGKPDEEPTSVTGAKLKGADLQNAHMESSFLVGADLTHANLSNVFLANANLRRVQLSGAQLAGTNFYDADLTGANLAGVHLSSSSLLSGANLSKADLSEARFVGTKLIDACLNNARLHDADFTSANLTYADLTNADLTGTNLSYADLTAANLRGANLRGTRLLGAVLKFADLREAHNVNANQIRSANAWDQAFYDDKVGRFLGLGANHNRKVGRRAAKQRESSLRQCPF